MGRQPQRSALGGSLEPQRGQSVSAAVTRTALGNTAELLMEKIVAPDTLVKAWNKVRSNHGAPGPDGITIKAFPDYCREHWPEIRQQLLGGTYMPSAARRKSIDKPDGGQRNLAP